MASLVCDVHAQCSSHEHVDRIARADVPCVIQLCGRYKKGRRLYSTGILFLLTLLVFLLTIFVPLAANTCRGKHYGCGRDAAVGGRESTRDRRLLGTRSAQFRYALGIFIADSFYMFSPARVCRRRGLQGRGLALFSSWTCGTRM